MAKQNVQIFRVKKKKKEKSAINGENENVLIRFLLWCVQCFESSEEYWHIQLRVGKRDVMNTMTSELDE